MRPVTFPLALVLSATLLPAAPLAPTIMSVSALDSVSIRVVWRDNSVDELGFILYHQRSGDTGWVVRDTVGANATERVDSGLRPETRYAYVVRAYNASGESVASNADSATTLAYVAPPLPPLVRATCRISLDTAHTRAVLSISDPNTTEVGYSILRGTTRRALVPMDSIISSTPADTGTTVYVDSTVSARRWYWYRVDAFRGDSTLAGGVDSIFTYGQPLLDSVPMQVVSRFSVHYAGWAVLQGDTLFCRETAGAQNSVSLISLADALQPRFLATADSALLRRYAATMVFTESFGDTADNLADGAVLGNAHIYRPLVNRVLRYGLNTGLDAFTLKDTLKLDRVGMYTTLVPNNLAPHGDNILGAMHVTNTGGLGGTGWEGVWIEVGPTATGYLVPEGFGFSCTPPMIGPACSIATGSRFRVFADSTLVVACHADAVGLHAVYQADQRDTLQWLYTCRTPGEPFAFCYPFVLWADTSAATIRITNALQADSATVLGSVDLGFTLRRALVDPARNYIVALGDLQAAMISVGADLRLHPVGVSEQRPQPAARTFVRQAVLRLAGTRLWFSSPSVGAVLSIHDGLGRRVAQYRQSGPGESFADLQHLPPGVYVARLSAGNSAVARTVLLGR